jgi:hypothetical protein
LFEWSRDYGVESLCAWATLKFPTYVKILYQYVVSGAPFVPDSCCSGDKQICTGVQTIKGPPSRGPPVSSLYAKNEHLYTQGCYEKVVVHLERNALILGGVAAFVPLLLVSL